MSDDTTEFPTPTGGPYAYGQPTTEPVKQKRSKKHLIGYPVTAIVALMIGSAGGGGTPAPIASPATVTATVAQPGAETTVTVPGPEVTKTVTVQAAAPAAPKPAAATTFGEGDYVVGEDIPAGTYKTVEAVTGMCYWGIYKSGTNQDDIIQNNIVQGGYPKVTLKKGQDFSSNGCGDWKKVG